MKPSLLSFGIVACLLSSQLQAVGKPYALAKEQALHVGNGTEPKELDPGTSTGVPESNIVDNIFEGLTSLHPVTLDPIPGVAESWTVSPDGKTYKFQIRKNAKWSDGKEITAEDFVWSWQRVLEPKTASEYAYQLYYIKNGEAFNKSQLKDPKQLGVKAVGKYTLEVLLENPTPYFLRLTAFHTLFPTPKHLIEKSSGLEWTKEGRLVSNGPFKLAEWRINRHVKIVPNEQYWDKDAVKLKEIYFYPTENSDTEEKTFTAGKLHITATVPALKIPHYETLKAETLKKDPNSYHTYKANPYLGMYFYRFNVNKKPMDDVRVRRALAMTVDRKLIVDRVVRGGQIPATSFTPPVAGYAYKGKYNLETSVTPAVIAEAKKLLAEAGYKDGASMPKIEILYNTSEDHKRIAVAIQQMWKKNLGIDVELFNQEWKVYLDTQRNMNFFLARAGWIGDYPDPNTFLDMFVTGGGNNQTGWSNKAYDALIEKASQSTNKEQRYEDFRQAEELLMKELPVLPIYVYTNHKLLAEEVKMLDPINHSITEWQSNLLDRFVYKYFVLVNK